VSYCADHDPILAAGYNTCGACRGRAWPVTAEWITDALILAAFGPVDGEPGCSGHHKPRILLVDLDAEDNTIPRAPERTRAEVAQRCGTSCIAAKADGDRCRNRPREDGLCGVHLAQREHRARKEAR
jgi:hypothetical protein